MREIKASDVAECVARLCVSACTELPEDVERAIRSARESEPWSAARDVLGDICENIDLAREGCAPLCQDTGLTTVLLRLGQDAHIVGGALGEAVQRGVAEGYTRGYLRKSVVRDPFDRVNTGDNTPAVVYTDVVPGDGLEITVMPKGAGSENMCRLAMLTPAQGEEGARRFVVDTVRSAGGSPCPPVVVGVGIGGGFDSVALLAKRSLLRPLGEPNGDARLARMEEELLGEINALGVGPAGFGGRTTALAVRVLAAPTHMAMLPVAVCISCHVLRHATEVL